MNSNKFDLREKVVIFTTLKATLPLAFTFEERTYF
jgi:hypothetical protein